MSAVAPIPKTRAGSRVGGVRGTLIGACIASITLLGYFQFPGHVVLELDTQIYVAILEHLWDPTALARDHVATDPAQLAFTIYDETALGLRWLTGFDFVQVLSALQFVFRAVGVWGIYLIATSTGLPAALALIVASILSLGATIGGPALLFVEYEPIPRGFALPSVLFAIGLFCHRRIVAGGIFLAIGLLYHPPTVWPVLAVSAAYCLWPGGSWTTRQRVLVLAPLVLGTLFLFLLSRLQAGVPEQHALFGRIDSRLEELQRLRAPYNWVSVWFSRRIGQYLFFWVVSLLVFFRLRRSIGRTLAVFWVGVPAIGLASIPISYVMLEISRLSFATQLQPARAVLFITAAAMLAAAIGGMFAARSCRWFESMICFSIAYLIPTQPELVRLFSPDSVVLQRTLAVLMMSATTCVAIWLHESAPRRSYALLAATAILPFFLIPRLGHLKDLPRGATADVETLAAWAREHTPRQAVFLFPGAGESNAPGIFRAKSVRAVYTDWKNGGQVNFNRAFAEEWWRRWQHPLVQNFDAQRLDSYQTLGVDYVVVPESQASPKPALFRNGTYAVYR